MDVEEEEKKHQAKRAVARRNATDLDALRAVEPGIAVSR